MKNAVLVSVALAAIILASGAQVQHAREEGPIEIDKCQTISQPGSYKLVSNLAITGGNGCLLVTAGGVTIDLAGFSIIGQQAGGAGVHADPFLRGISVRNGSISGFVEGVELAASSGSIVEGIRVSDTPGQQNGGSGIIAQGIVKGNTVSGMNTGIQGFSGTIADNYVENFTNGIFAQCLNLNRIGCIMSNLIS